VKIIPLWSECGELRKTAPAHTEVGAVVCLIGLAIRVLRSVLAAKVARIRFEFRALLMHNLTL